MSTSYSTTWSPPGVNGHLSKPSTSLPRGSPEPRTGLPRTREVRTTASSPARPGQGHPAGSPRSRPRPGHRELLPPTRSSLPLCSAPGGEGCPTDPMRRPMPSSRTTRAVHPRACLRSAAQRGQIGGTAIIRDRRHPQRTTCQCKNTLSLVFFFLRVILLLLPEAERKRVGTTTLTAQALTRQTQGASPEGTRAGINTPLCCSGMSLCSGNPRALTPNGDSLKRLWEWRSEGQGHRCGPDGIPLPIKRVRGVHGPRQELLTGHK